jgi:hypothetical protein
MKSLPWDMIGAIFGGLSFLLTLFIESHKLGILRRVILALTIGSGVFLAVYFIPPLIITPSVVTPTPTSFIEVTSSPTAPNMTPTSTQQSEITPSEDIGFPSSDLVSVSAENITFQTAFDKYSDYITNWDENGIVDLVDGIAIIGGKSSGIGRKKYLQSGSGILALFSYEDGTDSNIILFNDTDDKYIGIKPGTSGVMISLGYDGDWKGGQRLNGNLNPVANHWYYTLIEIRTDGEFYIKVWDKENPTQYLEKVLTMGSDWADYWHTGITTNQFNGGSIQVDSYWEVAIPPK